MSYLTTGLDLKLDGLDLAGEPVDGTSAYDGLAYGWMTEAQRALISGGTFGPERLEPADWLWARAWPRGTVQLQQPYNATGTITATFQTGSVTVFLQTGIATPPDLTGYRILRSDVPARHLILDVDYSQTPMQLILQTPWSGPNFTGDANWLAYPDTYQLPADFLRGLSPLFLYSFPSNLPTTQAIDVVEAVDLERMYPQTFPWGGNTNATITGAGLPVLAARVNQSRIKFSHFLNTPSNPVPVQAEFEYMQLPPPIAEGVIPMVPIQHRRILSYGLAYLILNDKKNSDADSKYGMFMAAYQALKQEQYRDMRRMSSRWGVIQPPRLSGNRAIMLTETGLPIYVW